MTEPTKVIPKRYMPPIMKVPTSKLDNTENRPVRDLKNAKEKLKLRYSSNRDTIQLYKSCTTIESKVPRDLKKIDFSKIVKSGLSPKQNALELKRLLHNLEGAKDLTSIKTYNGAPSVKKIVRRSAKLQVLHYDIPTLPASYLKNLARKKNLTDLHLSKNTFSDRALEELRNFMSKTKIKSLFLCSPLYDKVRRGVTVYDSLCRNSTLKSLNLQIPNITDKEMQKLIKTIKQNVIENFSFYGGASEDNTSNFVKLFTTLKDNTALKSLKLNLGHLGLEGSQALAKILEATTTLTKLDLKSCIMGGAEGILALVEGLKNNTSLKNLMISFDREHASEAVEEHIIKFILALKEVKTLQSIDLSISNITDKQCEALTDLFRSNTGLKSFTLRGVGMKAIKLDTLFTALGKNNHLKKLDFSQLVLSNLEIEELTKALLNNKSINTLSIRYGIRKEISDTRIQFLINLLKNNTNIIDIGHLPEDSKISLESLTQIEQLLIYNNELLRKAHDTSKANIVV